MRFGGHETFPVREGWLSRGLRLLMESPEVYEAEYPEDELGVGRNMYKSIRHWLVATELAEGNALRKGASRAMEPTELGRLIYSKDPFFLEEGTWWLLHVNLVNNPNRAMTWTWFFNHWTVPRFERGACVHALERYVQSQSTRVPRLKTMDRDLGCLLASYARKPSHDREDPEDTSESPFQELGLLAYHRSTGSYEFRRGVKRLPPAVFGYAAARSALQDLSLAEEHRGVDRSLPDWERFPGGPGRCFQMDSEALFEAVHDFEQFGSDHGIRIQGLAGERRVQVEGKSLLDWAGQTYEEMTMVGDVCA